MNASAKKLPRLDIFDGLRGHLLIGMLVAHLSFQDDLTWLSNLHHNRIILLFDAEFFVLIAGLLVGYLWTNVYKTSDRRRNFVTNRLMTIYRYYILSALPFLAYSLSTGDPFFQSIFGVLTMQLGGWYSDILPIYFVCFVLISPFAVISRLNKPKLMLAASSVIYVLSQFSETRGFFGFSDAFVVFDIAAWQFLFVCSIVIGQHGLGMYEKLKHANSSWTLMLFIGLTVCSILLRQNDFYPTLINPSVPLLGNAPRMELHPLFMLRIVLISAGIAIILIRSDIWFLPVQRAMQWYFNLSIIRNVGKFSIQMFVFHVYIMALYKVSFEDAEPAVKSTFAVVWIVVFIAVPNLWIFHKRRRRDRLEKLDV